jgi:hypothetical protein
LNNEGTNIMKTLSRLLAATLSACTAAAVQAAPPANIANTTWTLKVDGGADEVLVIDTQRGPGAPGNTYCREVRGTLGSSASVYGWYCPADGRLHLLHANGVTGVVVRAFMGNVSDEAAGQPLRIRGTTAIDYAALGDLGEVPFKAQRQ